MHKMLVFIFCVFLPSLLCGMEAESALSERRESATRRAYNALYGSYRLQLEQILADHRILFFNKDQRSFLCRKRDLMRQFIWMIKCASRDVDPDMVETRVEFKAVYRNVKEWIERFISLEFQLSPEHACLRDLVIFMYKKYINNQSDISDQEKQEIKAALDTGRVMSTRRVYRFLKIALQVFIDIEERYCGWEW